MALNNLNIFVFKKSCGFLVLLYTLLCQSATAQNADSLKKALLLPANDTTRVQQLIALGKYYNNQNIDTALLFYNQAQLVATKSNDKQGLAKTLSAKGYSYYLKANYPMALSYQLKALKLYTQLQNQAKIANCYNSIGLIFKNQMQYHKALNYFKKALVIAEKNNKSEQLAVYSYNIANIFLKQKKYDLALSTYSNALVVCKITNDSLGESQCLTNIAIVYYNKTNYPKALEYYEHALSISQQINDKEGINILYYNLGDVNNQLKQYQPALSYFTKGLALSKELGDADNTMLCYLGLSETQNHLGNYKEAYQYHVAYQELNDSIFNQENSQQLSDLKTNFEVDKKAVELNAKHDIETAKQQAELKTKRQQQYALFGGLALVVVFAGIMYNRFKVTQKQKHIIELKEQETQQQNAIITEQKKLVEHKHQEITDSINYAERIQRSFMATKELLNNFLQSPISEVSNDIGGEFSSPLGRSGGADYFVFFRPKDVVSGDFYWAKTLTPTLGGGGLRKPTLRFL